MKYKVGDKVKLKNWEELIKEYHHSSSEFISYIKKTKFATITTARIHQSLGVNCYNTDNIDKWLWIDKDIECLAKDYKEPEPIYSRFDILDIRD